MKMKIKTNIEYVQILFIIKALEGDDSKILAINENNGANNIKSIVYNNGKILFICYIDNDNDLSFIIFDIIKNLFEI